jgi:hypothetical protein
VVVIGKSRLYRRCRRRAGANDRNKGFSDADAPEPVQHDDDRQQDRNREKRKMTSASIPAMMCAGKIIGTIPCVCIQAASGSLEVRDAASEASDADAPQPVRDLNRIDSSL